MTTTTDKPVFDLEVASHAAERLADWLADAAEQVAIAGSIRRNRPEVHDIDLVVVPRVEQVTVGLLGETEPHCCVSERLDRLAVDGFINPLRGGGKVRRCEIRARFCRPAVPADIYIVPPEQFAMALLIRTGSAEHNIKLCQAAAARGLKVDVANYRLIRRVRDETHAVAIDATDEAAIFKAVGLPFIGPELREVS